MAAWLRLTHRFDAGEATSWRRTASWLESHPIVASAFACGDITAEHVHAIRRTVSARKHRALVFEDFEEAIVEVARHADPARTRQMLRAWADQIDPDGTDADDAQKHERRRLFLSQLADGWSVNGWLPDAEGAELAGILNEIMERRFRSGPDGQAQGDRGPDGLAADEQTAGQPSPDDRGASGACRDGDTKIPLSAQRADALMDLVRAAAEADLSTAERGRARVVVVVPVDRLTEGPQDVYQRRVNGSAPDLSSTPEQLACSWRTGNGPGGGFLGVREARRLACDGQIQRLVIGPKSQPLDIGRLTRVVPPGLRTAVELRDGGCVVPGCDRPPGWCEAHHVQHWADGGRTALTNLALMCSRHHHELHNGVWDITIPADGRPQVRRC